MTSYEADIRPLFRSRDRQVMDFVFDLWDYHDVRANSASILERLEDGTMPCDGEWNGEHLALFRSWVEKGCPP